MSSHLIFQTVLLQIFFFYFVMSSYLFQRNESELDKELLELTGKVLLSNPDIYTLWNIRREILVILM